MDMLSSLTSYTDLKSHWIYVEKTWLSFALIIILLQYVFEIFLESYYSILVCRIYKSGCSAAR